MDSPFGILSIYLSLFFFSPSTLLSFVLFVLFLDFRFSLSIFESFNLFSVSDERVVVIDCSTVSVTATFAARF